MGAKDGTAAASSSPGVALDTADGVTAAASSPDATVGTAAPHSPDVTVGATEGATEPAASTADTGMDVDTGAAASPLPKRRNRPSSAGKQARKRARHGNS